MGAASDGMWDRSPGARRSRLESRVLESIVLEYTYGTWVEVAPPSSGPVIAQFLVAIPQLEVVQQRV